MNVVDVNVLLAGAVASHQHHGQALRVLKAGKVRLGIPSVAASAYLRLITDRRIFTPPQPPQAAMTFLEALMASPTIDIVDPGPRHWQIFRDLVLAYETRSVDVPDAYLAALAIERGATLVSFDRGFARFRELSWVNPADSD